VKDDDECSFVDVDLGKADDKSENFLPVETVEGIWPKNLVFSHNDRGGICLDFRG